MVVVEAVVGAVVAVVVVVAVAWLQHQTPQDLALVLERLTMTQGVPPYQPFFSSFVPWCFCALPEGVPWPLPQRYQAYSSKYF